MHPESLCARQPLGSTFLLSPILQRGIVRLRDWGRVGVGTFPVSVGTETSKSPLGFPVPIPQNDKLRREWGMALPSQESLAVPLGTTASLPPAWGQTSCRV